MSQPIIRGIQAVGSVSIRYTYNGNGGKLKLPEGLIGIKDQDKDVTIDTSKGVEVSGFRLDSNFLQANPQIASSFQIPLLGGGAIALTNNNRSGVLNIACTRVSTPVSGDATVSADNTNLTIANAGNKGAMARVSNLHIGPDTNDVYDLAFLAQIQQAQPGGDSLGATIVVSFKFCGLFTVLQFQGCTIANVAPVGLSGNDAVDYQVQINYLNWTMNTSNTSDTVLTNGV